MPDNRYRVITNRNTMQVVSVVLDQDTTITSYPEVDHEHHVVHNLEVLKQGLISAGYNVDAITTYQNA